MFANVFITLATVTPAPAEAVDASSLAVESVWDFVVKGGVMMIPIGICSFVAFTIVMERLITLRRKRILPPTFVAELRMALPKIDSPRKKAIELCKKNGSSLANVMLAGLRRLDAPVEHRDRHIDEAGQREIFKLRKYLRVLSVIAAVTPLMGLLGTILGMIDAFQTVATSPDALGRTELLAEGIYQAMITTAGGLIVAIPVLMSYHWLSSRIQKLVMDLDLTTLDFFEDLAAGTDTSEVMTKAVDDANERPSELDALDASVAPAT